MEIDMSNDHNQRERLVLIRTWAPNGVTYTVFVRDEVFNSTEDMKESFWHCYEGGLMENVNLADAISQLDWVLRQTRGSEQESVSHAGHDETAFCEFTSSSCADPKRCPFLSEMGGCGVPGNVCWKRGISGTDLTVKDLLKRFGYWKE